RCRGAAAMRGECRRVGPSFQAAPPSIVPGTQAPAGSGVGSAVFPPVDQTGQAQAGNVQTPYQPGPTPAPHPYGTPAPSPSYGYPQQGGYATPHPAAYSAQPGPSTPAPYTISPQAGAPGGQGGGRSNRPVTLRSTSVALLAVGGLIAALTVTGGGSQENKGGGGSPSASAT